LTPAGASAIEPGSGPRNKLLKTKMVKKELAAAAKCSVDVGHTAVFMPKRYETIRTENFDGVLLAFDRGAESEMMIGLDHASAHDIGKDLRKQRGVGLLLPQNNLVS